MSCMSKFNNVSNYNMNIKFDSSFPNLPCFECPSYLHILSYLMVGFSSILVSLIMCSYKRGWVHAHFISQTMSCFHLPLVVGHSSSLPNRSHWLFEQGPILINPPSPWTGPVLVGLPRHGIGHVLTIYSRPWTGPIFNSMPKPSNLPLELPLPLFILVGLMKVVGASTIHFVYTTICKDIMIHSQSLI